MPFNEEDVRERKGAGEQTGRLGEEEEEEEGTLTKREGL